MKLAVEIWFDEFVVFRQYTQGVLVYLQVSLKYYKSASFSIFLGHQSV